MFLRTILPIAALCVAGAAFADDRDEARARMPQQIEWQGHYLVLEGENFLPIESGFATPNITVLIVEDDYLPSGKSTLETAIDGCTHDQTKAQSVTDGGISRATLKADVAADYASAGAIRAENRKHCPERLGKVFGAGSYVYDEAFTQLAGQDFDEGVQHWRGWRLHTDPVESEEVIIIGQGGAKREDDPALDIYGYDNGMIVDVLFDPETFNGRQEPGLGEAGPMPAPELPIKVTGEFWNEIQFGNDNDELADIGQISDALDAALKAAADKAVDKFDALIISRGAPPERFSAAKERLDALKNTAQDRLGADAKITTVSLGIAAPVCDDADQTCWVLNRSTILYLQPRG